jgi:hypothetical protein
MPKHSGSVVTIIALAAMTVAGFESERLDSIEARVDRALTKAGIQFGGEFRSRFLLSRIGGPGMVETRRSDESVEYTSVDFDIRARPVDAVRGRLVFRMHQDWRNFFSDIANPIFTRWISIDGTVRELVRWNVGDFRARYSPLTLYAPQVSIPYEPAIFASLREEAMGEEFLGDNRRVLQGVNARFDAQIVPLFDEFHLGVLGTRLRTSQTSIENGSRVTAALEAAPMDRYGVGGNLDILIREGLGLGGTYLSVFDATASFNGSDTVADTMAAMTGVAAGRLSLGTALFLDPEPFTLTADIEVARSRDDTAWYDVDSAGADDAMHLREAVITGRAVRAGVHGALLLGGRGLLELSAAIVNNDADYRNQLAQSPTFFAERVMNFDNDSLDRSNVVSRHYSTFDALYRYVFKFTPSSQTNQWAKAPMRKLAYSNAILSTAELAVIEDSLLDPAVQLLMPYGPATPNRSGIEAEVALSLLDGGLRASGELAALEQIEGEKAILPLDSLPSRLPATIYRRYGGGAAVDLAALIPPLTKRLALQGGYRLSTAANEGAAGRDSSAYDIAIAFVNGGVSWHFWKRATALAGFQRITTDLDALDSKRVERTVQDHWAAGLRYRVGEGGTLTGSVGQTLVRFDRAPDNDFDQWQIELYLTVTF